MEQSTRKKTPTTTNNKTPTGVGAAAPSLKTLAGDKAALNAELGKTKEKGEGEEGTN